MKQQRKFAARVPGGSEKSEETASGFGVDHRHDQPHSLAGGSNLFISVKAVEWVLENSQSSGNPRNVLFVIAAHCDSDGCAWPSLDTIARLSHVSRPTAILAIKELQAMGEIETRTGGGRGKTNFYYLTQFMENRKNSKEFDPKQERNGKETVKADSVSPSEENGLAPLVREKENNKTEEEPGEVFKCLKRIFRQNTGKGLKSIGRYGEEFRYLVEKKTGDVVLEAFKLWLLENKEFAKECDWPMAAFMKNVNEKIEAYEDKVAGEQDEEEEEGLPRLKPEGI